MTTLQKNRPHFEPHNDDSLSSSNWLRAAVLGANDGIVSVAALVVGVAGATSITHDIFIAGIDVKYGGIFEAIHRHGIHERAGVANK